MLYGSVLSFVSLVEMCTGYGPREESGDVRFHRWATQLHLKSEIRLGE